MSSMEYVRRLCDLDGVDTLDQIEDRKQQLLTLVADLSEERDEAKASITRSQMKREGYGNFGMTFKRFKEEKARSLDASQSLRLINAAMQTLSIRRKRLRDEFAVKRDKEEDARKQRLQFQLLHFVVVVEREIGYERAAQFWTEALTREAEKRLCASRVMDEHWARCGR